MAWLLTPVLSAPPGRAASVAELDSAAGEGTEGVPATSVGEGEPCDTFVTVGGLFVVSAAELCSAAALSSMIFVADEGAVVPPDTLSVLSGVSCANASGGPSGPSMKLM